jgi:phage shock protein A
VVGYTPGDVGLAIAHARDRTQGMMARANAIEELTAAGSLEDFIRQGDRLGHELAQLSSEAQVESDLARLRKELGTGATAEHTTGADANS